MKCRFCGKEFEDYMELREHEMECYNKLQKEKEDKERIEREKREEQEKLINNMIEDGKEINYIINNLVNKCEEFKNRYEKVDGFHKWEEMLITNDSLKKIRNSNDDAGESKNFTDIPRFITLGNADEISENLIKLVNVMKKRCLIDE